MQNFTFLTEKFIIQVDFVYKILAAKQFSTGCKIQCKTFTGSAVFLCESTKLVIQASLLLMWRDVFARKVCFLVVVKIPLKIWLVDVHHGSLYGLSLTACNRSPKGFALYKKELKRLYIFFNLRLFGRASVELKTKRPQIQKLSLLTEIVGYQADVYGS